MKSTSMKIKIRKHDQLELAKVNRVSAGIANSYSTFVIGGKSRSDRKLDRQMKSIFANLKYS